MFAFLQFHFMSRVLRPASFAIGLSLFVSQAYASGDHDHDHSHEEKPSAHETPSHEHDHDNHDHDESHDEAHEQDNKHEDHNEHETEHADDHSDDEHAHAESVKIDATTAKRSNIVTAPAHSGAIAQTQRVFGKVVNDASQVSHIGARFDGTIIQVNVSVGDRVKKGAKLARIESNQSLHPYYVTAPFDGVIIERHANPGELTQDQPLFTLFNDKILWAEFKVFPNQMRIIKAEQNVIIDNEVFTIAHILPNTNNAPYELARVRLDNHDHGWRAGVTLKGDVITQTKTVNVRIVNKAMQQVEGNTVVFVKHGNEYTATPVSLGLQDHQFSEVLSGLNVNDEYVVENSYLIKADFEKAGAEHVH